MVWVIRDGKPVRVTMGRQIAITTIKARASARWHILLEAADEGLSLEDAAKRAGMKPDSVRETCYAKLGSKRWPPRIEELQNDEHKS